MIKSSNGVSDSRSFFKAAIKLEDLLNLYISRLEEMMTVLKKGDTACKLWKRRRLHNETRKHLSPE